MVNLFLSRLALDTRRPEVQNDLANCHWMHQRILSGFPDNVPHDVPHLAAPVGEPGARARNGVLYRVEPVQPMQAGQVIVLVQSTVQPEWGKLLPKYLREEAATKSLDGLYTHIQPGMQLRFRLRANPSCRRQVATQTAVMRPQGKRVGLLQDHEQLAWLERKAEQSGFRLASARVNPAVPDARISERSRVGGTRNHTGTLTFTSVLFDGRLSVVDADRFRQALADGIGSGKAYGFGLLSLAPIRL